jgi:hypothetical protein
MKLMVPSIKPVGPATRPPDTSEHTLELLGEIDALLDESLATALTREQERRRRACMAVHPSAGQSAAALAAVPSLSGPSLSGRSLSGRSLSGRSSSGHSRSGPVPPAAA